jgi:hypothetical protein
MLQHPSDNDLEIWIFDLFLGHSQSPLAGIVVNALLPQSHSLKQLNINTPINLSVIDRLRIPPRIVPKLSQTHQSCREVCWAVSRLIEGVGEALSRHRLPHDGSVRMSVCPVWRNSEDGKRA